MTPDPVNPLNPLISSKSAESDGVLFQNDSGGPRTHPNLPLAQARPRRGSGRAWVSFGKEKGPTASGNVENPNHKLVFSWKTSQQLRKISKIRIINSFFSENEPTASGNVENPDHKFAVSRKRDRPLREMSKIRIIHSLFLGKATGRFGKCRKSRS